MEQQEVEDFIEDALRDGYSVDEVHEALREEGVSEQKLRNAINNIRSRQRAKQETGRQRTQERDPEQGRNTTSQTSNIRRQHQNVITKIDLTEDEYTIKQRLLFNRYHIYDPDNELILKAKQKMFKLKEDFPFMDADNNVVFRVKAEQMVDAAGDYTLIDEETEKPVMLLNKKFTLFRHRWRIRDPETEELLAKVQSHNQTVELFRWIGNLIPYVPNLFGFIPHRYDIEDRNGNLLASLNGKFHIRDIYQLELKDTEDIPREALVAGAIAIDALEGN